MARDKKCIDFVVCRLCRKHFKRITNTHLEKFHRITMKEYMKKFSGAAIEVEKLKESRGENTRGKSYEEIYGAKRAKQIKKRRGKTLVKTYRKDEELRKSRGQSRKKQSEDEKIKKGYKKSICKTCGKEFWYNSRDRRGVYCSIRCKSKDQKNVSLKIWKTTRSEDRNTKKKVIDERGLVCEKCGKKVNRSGDLCLHHLSYDYYSSDLSIFLLLCKSCHVKLHNKIRREEQKFAGISTIKRAVHSLLKSMKIPLDDPNFKDTPHRVSRMYMELCSGLFLDFNKEIKDILSTMFPSKNDKMIIYKGETVGMCPHHLLPVLYRYHIGIIPKGYVLGASKPLRLMELFCSIPDLQEDITTKVKDSLVKMLSPQGIFVLIKGKHMCMRVRGVKMESSELTTSAIGGSFTEVEVRAEFLSLIKE